MKKLLLMFSINLFFGVALAQVGDPNLSGSTTEANENVDELESAILSYLEPYIYDAERRRDPFLPFKIFVQEPSIEDQFQQEETPIQSEVEQPAHPLLGYNLSQLSLKAILWNVKNPKIIINDPVNKLHVLRKNDRIGNNGGYIAAIREGEVVVVQKVSVQGKDIVTTKYLRLKR